VRRHIATISFLGCLTLLVSPVAATAQSDEPSALTAPSAKSFWAPFAEVPADLRNFVSKDSLKILAPAAVGALFGSQFDHEGIGMAMSRFQPADMFVAGNVGGGFYAQTGGAFALYTIGYATKSEKVRTLGSDLVRAQILTQLTVQTSKYVIQRRRPDSSDHLSLPSGHTAGTFATATVLQRHFGWKVGFPAYAAGAYVATSRMSANKHHLSDVIMGAAFGIAAAHTVTIGTGTNRFAMNVGPTHGGGVVTFTKKQDK
jgi:membrane-associated phospholipid phosphatase